MKTNKFVGFDFNRDGWSTTHENKSTAFEAFVKAFRSDLKAMLKGTDWEVRPFKGNWFTMSGFLYNTYYQQWVYWSVSDVRYFQDWWNTKLLYRTAANDKDFRGGVNHETRFEKLPEALDSLLKSW